MEKRSLGRGIKYSLEKFLVEFLDLKRILDPTSNVIAYHEPSKLFSVDEHDPLT
jgi:hypothetical protein